MWGSNLSQEAIVKELLMDMFYQKGVSAQKGKEQASDIGQR